MSSLIKRLAVPVFLGTTLFGLVSCGTAKTEPVSPIAPQSNVVSQNESIDSLAENYSPAVVEEPSSVDYTPGQQEVIGLSGAAQAQEEKSNEVDCSLDSNKDSCFPSEEPSLEVDYSKLTPGNKLEFLADDLAPRYHGGTNFEKTFGVSNGGKDTYVIVEHQTVQADVPTVDIADDGITYRFENVRAKELFFEMKRIYSDMISRESGLGDGSVYKSRLNSEHLAAILFRTDSIVRDKMISEDEAYFEKERVERAYNNQITSYGPLQNIDKYFEPEQAVPEIQAVEAQTVQEGESYNSDSEERNIQDVPLGDSFYDAGKKTVLGEPVF